jgi:hypothetical protein
MYFRLSIRKQHNIELMTSSCQKGIASSNKHRSERSRPFKKTNMLLKLHNLNYHTEYQNMDDNFPRLRMGQNMVVGPCHLTSSQSMSKRVPFTFICSLSRALAISYKNSWLR